MVSMFRSRVFRPRTRKPWKKSTSKSYSGTRKNWSKTRVLPRVQNAGRLVARRTRSVVNKVMKNISELKINEMVPVNCDAPLPIVPAPGATAIYKAQYNIGPSISAWSGFTPIQGTSFAQGTGANQRIGKYVYLKNSSVRVKIQMNDVPQAQTNPTRFRVIVFKTRRNYVAGTTGGNPEDNLFLNPLGGEFGVNTLGLESMDYESSLVNKKNYMVVKDQQFILQPITSQPVGQSIIANAGVYKNEKYLYFNLGHYKKVAMEPGTNDNPADLNYQYAICILGTPVGSCRTPAKNWNVSIRGTTSCLDN